MPTVKQSTPDPDELREQWLNERLRGLCAEDNFAHGLEHLGSYPRFESRPLSLFEDDLRDWGYAYGLAFGLALGKWPDEPHENLAQLVFASALAVYRRWAGEIEDPVVKREMAIRQLAQVFADHADERDDRGRVVMSNELHTAVVGLSESARG